MKVQINLSMDDVVDIVQAALQYNGYQPLSVSWRNAEGLDIQPPDTMAVYCENQPLAVRVKPEATMEERLKNYRRQADDLLSRAGG